MENSHNNMNMKIIAKVYTSLIYWKFQPKYNKSHVPLEMKSKHQDKICSMLETNNVVFSYKVPTTISLFSKLCV
jgi:hypothetical protein